MKYGTITILETLPYGKRRVRYTNNVTGESYEKVYKVEYLKTAETLFFKKLANRYDRKWYTGTGLFNWDDHNNDDIIEKVVTYMEDDIRETVHCLCAPCTNTIFINEYAFRDPEFAGFLETEFNIYG